MASIEEALDLAPWSGQAVDDADRPIHAMRRAIEQGEHWYLALLDAVRAWRRTEEVVDGRVYRYLIGGEAFDWLLVAERLYAAAADLIPVDEAEALLFYGRPPIELSPAEFQRRIGPQKYRGYLNYFYGITVEEALQLVMAREIQKEQMASCYKTNGAVESVHERIYFATEAELLKRFRAERGLPERHSLSYSELKEFTYWLFKYRLRECHRAKVACDTRRALDELARQRARKGLDARIPEDPEASALIIDV